MTMQLKFTSDTLSILNDERYSHPVPIVQRRMEALWLKSHNLPHSQIASLVGVCENTVRDYFEWYREGGIEGLKTVRFHRPGSELDAQSPHWKPISRNTRRQRLKRHNMILKP